MEQHDSRDWVSSGSYYRRAKQVESLAPAVKKKRECEEQPEREFWLSKRKALLEFSKHSALYYSKHSFTIIAYWRLVA